MPLGLEIGLDLEDVAQTGRETGRGEPLDQECCLDVTRLGERDLRRDLAEGLAIPVCDVLAANRPLGVVKRLIGPKSSRLEGTAVEQRLDGAARARPESG